jgi:hypothetical protein
MITGYNTDIEHDGVVYHVQTEDKGLETPLVLSLVYAGGAILASKRSSYHDLIAAGFDEAVLVERLQRQHRLICAAINAGRIADLKKMGAPPPRVKGRTAELRMPQADPPEAVTETPVEPTTPSEAEPARLEEHAEPSAVVVAPASGSRKKTNVSPYSVYDSRRRSPMGDVPDIEDGLRISLVGESSFRGGETVQMQVVVTRVSREAETPMSAAISVKILGTSFRPVILALKADRQGVASFSTRIPPFKSGRAAIVIKATAAELSAETRRVIHPG